MRGVSGRTGSTGGELLLPVPSRELGLIFDRIVAPATG